MEIIQKEKNGIVCVTIKGRMGAELTPQLEKVIREIIRNLRAFFVQKIIFAAERRWERHRLPLQKVIWRIV